MTGYRYEAMWPINDDDLTVAQLAQLAEPELHRLARMSGAQITGPIQWTVGTGPGAKAILHASAGAVVVRDEPGVDERALAVLLAEGVTIWDLERLTGIDRTVLEDVALRVRHIDMLAGEHLGRTA